MKENDQTDISNQPIGLQLWSLRADMEENPGVTIQKVADMGYNYIESYAGPQGIFWGMKPQEFSSFLSDHGLYCLSSHVDPKITMTYSDLQLGNLVEQACEAGIEYLVNPWLGYLKDDKLIRRALRKLADHSSLIEDCKIVYHHHHFEIENNPQGKYIDLLLELCRNSPLQMELDIYWLREGGEDPLPFLKKHKDVYELVHLKDRLLPKEVNSILSVEKPEDDFFPVNLSCCLGNGCLDVEGIVDWLMQEDGVHLIVEQERYKTSPMDCITKNYHYLSDIMKHA